jgi:hypothetical protein
MPLEVHVFYLMQAGLSGSAYQGWLIVWLDLREIASVAQPTQPLYGGSNTRLQPGKSQPGEKKCLKPLYLKRASGPAVIRWIFVVLPTAQRHRFTAAVGRIPCTRPCRARAPVWLRLHACAYRMHQRKVARLPSCLERKVQKHNGAWDRWRERRDLDTFDRSRSLDTRRSAIALPSEFLPAGS